MWIVAINDYQEARITLYQKKKKSITITKEKGQKLLQVYKFHFNI
jgi:hypothetical protein